MKISIIHINHYRMIGIIKLILEPENVGYWEVRDNRVGVSGFRVSSPPLGSCFRRLGL